MIQHTLTQEDAIRHLFSDRCLAISTLLEIENKNRQLVPFILNPIQEDMIRTATGRDVYVKPAQIGATSAHLADFYLDNITINGTVSVIISYDEFSAKRLILKAKKFDSALRRRIPSIAKLDHKGAAELTWVNDKEGFYSVMYIFSARSYTIGRGEAIHNLLADEFGFWPEGTHEETFASAFQRVPLLPNTKVRVNSTANGEENPHCEIYRTAKEGSSYGTSVYKDHFYPWFIHPEYTMDTDNLFCLDGDEVNPLPNLQPAELTLMDIMVNSYKFSPQEAMDKIRWRRYKERELASLRRTGETIRLFPQEFPEDDESCFISVGNSAYNPDIVAEKIRSCYPAPTHMQLINPKNGVSVSADIWIEPEEGRGYLLSIDPGKAKSSESVAHIWYFEDGYEKDGQEIPPRFVHCATLAGKYDEWEMAEYCMDLAKKYNECVIAPEDNLDIVSHLREYPSLYYREDVRDGRSSRRVVGWQMNISTKPYMITEVNRHLDHIECHDIRFWSQCKNIRSDPSSKSLYSVVGADDHHDAGAIAIVCRSAQAVHRGFVGSYGWADDWGT